MKVLQLIIKEIHFKNILNGTKTIETREIRPSSFNKYYEYSPSGDLIGLRAYDAIQFYVGYNPDRKAALVEIVSCEMIALVDDAGDYITYQHNGEDHAEVNAEFTLGKILNKANC